MELLIISLKARYKRKRNYEMKHLGQIILKIQKTHFQVFIFKL